MSTEIQAPDKWTALKERYQAALSKHEEAERRFALRPQRLIKAPGYQCVESVLDSLICYVNGAELVRLHCEKQFQEVAKAIREGAFDRARVLLNDASRFYEREQDLANHVKLGDVIFARDN